MSLTALEYSLFATDVYMRPDNTSPGEFNLPLGATEFLSVDRSLDGIDFQAYAYLVGSEVVLAIRGADQLLTDLNQAAGLNTLSLVFSSPQIEAAFEFYNEVAAAAALQGYSVTLTGHSLGGGLAGLIASISSGCLLFR
jgi:hypothetical protein